VLTVALIERGRVPSDRNFQIAFLHTVGDLRGSFDVPGSVLDALENSLVLEDALEASSIDVDRLGDDDEGMPTLALSCDELQSLVTELNDMGLDGDTEASGACEAILNALGFEWA